LGRFDYNSFQKFLKSCKFLYIDYKIWCSFTRLLYVMSILVYNGEKFQRSKVRYLIFAVIFASVFLLSILNNNIVGAVLLFFLLWWYFYYSTINNQLIKLTINNNQLMLWSKIFPRNTFIWYVVEIYPKTQKIKNIVFLTQKWHMIYTFDDSLEHIRLFLLELDWYLPMLGDFHQTGFEKFSRKMKL